MTERKEFMLTDEQYNKLLDACKPVTYMVIGGIQPKSPQENANDAWKSLGKEMGFDGMTVLPSTKGEKFFTAIITNEAALADMKRLAEEEAARGEE